MLLALLMVIVPVVVMSFFRDRKERYLLPMIVPASVVIARAVVEHFRTRQLRARGGPGRRCDSLGDAAGDRDWVSGRGGRHVEDAGWHAVVFGAGGVQRRRDRRVDRRRRDDRALARRCGAIVASTLLLMLGVQMLFIHGYRNSREGRSEMKPLAAMILEKAPDAAAFTTGRSGCARRPTLRST
jgi:hypothetical protein